MAANSTEAGSEKIDALAAAVRDCDQLGLDGLAGEAWVLRAEAQLKLGHASHAVRDDLAHALESFRACNHVHGPVDCERVSALLSIQRDFGGLEPLGRCVERYREIDFPRGALTTLMDLAQIAQEKGDARLADGLWKDHRELAESVGYGLLRSNNQLARADLLVRSGRYGEAIELCASAAHTTRTQAMIASFEVIESSARSFVNDYSGAAAAARRALKRFDELASDEQAATVATQLCNGLNSRRTDAAWDESETIIRDRLGIEGLSAENRSTLHELAAQIDILRFTFPGQYQGDPDRIEIAETSLEASWAAASTLPERDRTRHAGSHAEMRAQLATARGDDAMMVSHWREALDHFTRGDFSMQMANCKYILGVFELNQANRSTEINQEVQQHAAESARLLEEALEYYEEEGVRAQAINARRMLSLLFKNVAVRLQDPESLLHEALSQLEAAEQHADAMRREFSAGTIADAQLGKRGLVEESRPIYELALEILALHWPTPSLAWPWVQRSKSRSLVDSLANCAVPPRYVLDRIRSSPDSMSRMERERGLQQQLATASIDDRSRLRSELAAVLGDMESDPNLAEYLELRTGEAVDAGDLETMTRPGRTQKCVFVDWTFVGNHLLLFSIRPGEEPKSLRIEMGRGQLESFVSRILGPRHYRSTLRDTPELLRSLDPLIAPLMDWSDPEDLLVLSPAGPLHAIPLHALEIEGSPLIERNPVVFTPSLSVTRHCAARRRRMPARPSAALFGDPCDDREEAAALVRSLGQRLESEPLLGSDVTRDSFAETIVGRDIIHFQGHAKHDPVDPLASKLVFADEEFLTARDFLELQGVSARLVSLGACESAASVVKTGNEILGMIPTLLYAGAASVLATLWPVNQSSSAEFMDRFYSSLLSRDRGRNGAPDLAEAVREAILEIRSVEEFNTPYHWAPFVVHGDWHWEHEEEGGDSV